MGGISFENLDTNVDKDKTDNIKSPQETRVGRKKSHVQEQKNGWFKTPVRRVISSLLIPPIVQETRTQHVNNVKRGRLLSQGQSTVQKSAIPSTSTNQSRDL